MSRKSLYMPRFFLFFSRHIQAIRTSFHQLGASPVASLMTFAVIGIALALPFGLYALLQNIQGVSHNLHDSAQISLYLNHDISDSSKNELLRVLTNDNDVAHVTYISPEEGLNEFQKDSDFNNVLAALKTNPLPAVLVIQPSTSAQTPLKTEQLTERLERLPNVTNVQLDMQWLQRFNAILLLIHRMLAAIILLFSIGVLLIIGNTIRLTTQHHRDEIFVMKLLGASDRFIRRPFLYAGIIYGLAGSIIAWLLVDFTLMFLQSPISRLANLYGTNFELKELDLPTTLALLVTGSALGYIGSRLAVRQHVRAIEPGETI